MKTYKVVYTLHNKDGRYVAFYQATCADFARMKAMDELGGFGVVVIWDVVEVNM